MNTVIFLTTEEKKINLKHNLIIDEYEIGLKKEKSGDTTIKGDEKEKSTDIQSIPLLKCNEDEVKEGKGLKILTPKNY